MTHINIIMSKIELDDLYKTSAGIADELLNKPNALENIESPSAKLDTGDQFSKAKPVRRVNFQSTTSTGGNVTSDQTKPPIKTETKQNSCPPTETKQNSCQPIDSFCIAGLNLPKHTLYLFVILIAIGFMIYRSNL